MAVSRRPHRIHVNLPHPDHPHHHPQREHIAHLPYPSFKLTPVKRYRMSKKPDVGEEKLIWLRNIFAAVAAVLFLIAMAPGLAHHAKYAIRGVAYIFGAGAYLSEILMITDCFKHIQPFREMFMAYAFGILYVLMSISYFLEM